MSTPERIVVVGGGPAGQRCALALRRRGHGGAIDLVGDERLAPYDRTLLSKDALRGEREPEPVALAPAGAYAEAGVTVHAGARATGLDAHARTVALDDGRALSYDRLVIATGGRPSLPPALRCDGVLTVRTAADVAPLRDALVRARHLVVIGGGFIGGEIASAAVALAAPVTLVEAAEHPLAPVLGAEVAEHVTSLHRAAGVEVRCGAAVTSVRRERDGWRVALADGAELRADAVIAGVGMVPAVDWLDGSPLTIDDGIVTDERCRTDVDGVLAAGDCARWHNPRYGRSMRVEHWDTACRHGEAAAANALGIDTPFAPLPFFWSEQHGVVVRYAGHAPEWDAVEVQEGEQPHEWVARYLHDGRLVAACAAGRPRDFAAARRELDQPTKEHAPT
ncbi:NAD(P)/FAD-dependent oxidoreductase [Conexibacter woesei]|uniref:FAD-dependent pyridine nucleotide-disulphide oxidoreductase n=1 Tax=Conexibacter woesei (strain DSM 14684 / CCUG 47730 / CIP 108061 / JCM 11494 / NBRC 100937 / ID131577) TaxID=469383 RepID=D3F9T5_CONWI|nr:FAD-dependent oxidoreductase [Conexibacter woesei]ADB51147.1 FAD-dependent pyridine nucleotide-disulphide oxidoreductase [Conexibacter woesei DSM 14684]